MSLFENFEYGTFAGDVIDAADGVSDVGDVIFGLGGADWLFGLGGCDWLDGGAGGDYLNGGSDFDTASYEYSNAGVTIDLTNGYGYGGTAAGDTLESIENVTGSPYGDTLLGNDVHNVLWGMSGNDVLKGGGGDDELRGVNGDDTLEGGAGADFLQGAWGVDTAAYTTSDEGVMVALWSGAAHYGDAEGDTFGAIENLTGSNHADSLIGDDGVNVLRGMSGNDSLKGLGGADTLEGGFGDDHLDGDTGGDTMIGGFGDDTYYVDNWWDVVTEAGGQGADTVLTSVSWELTAGADVEYLRTTNPNGTAAINLTGNASGNAIVGNDGNNLIIGGGGVDEMTGRDGNDSYFVDNAGDMVIESGGQGIDAVRASVSYTLAAGVDVETLSTTQLAGTDAINLTGNSSGSVVVGNNGMNWLNGGAGNDELIGNGGMDYFVFNTALDAASNVDELSDFNQLWDTIVIDDAIFGGLTGGGLAQERFVIGAAAQDANDNIIYNQATGALMYDSDGSGAAAAIQFAQLNPATALTHTDFWVL